MKRFLLAALLAPVLITGVLAAEPPIARPSPQAPVPSTPATNDYAAPVLAGISNRGRNKQQPYVTAGDRTYLIGTQDGNFPDMGQHVPGEMGGLWLPPIKLIDAFQARIAEDGSDQETLLSESQEMVTYPYGNLFRYGRLLDDIDVDRFQFSPDHRQGLIVQYRFRNASERVRRLRLEWSVKTDLRPGWYSDRLGIRDGQDVVEWRPDDRVFVARDPYNPWFCAWGAVSSADARRIEHPRAIQTNGRGVTAASSHTVTVGPHATATLTFVVSGSTSSEQDAIATYQYLASNHVALLAEKVARYGAMINRARIRIPDAKLQEVYNWTRINMEWLVREVPGIGRGLSAGFMEYPWWFGTETYSLQALTASGDFDLAKQTLRLLRDQSSKVNGNGRIAHEITTDGAVANPGNTQETAQFVLTVGKVFEWTGDRDFAREMYPAMKRGIDWLLGDMDRNKDLFPEGYGIMEVYGLNAELIDVAVYTQQALEAAARMAEVLSDTEAKDHYRKLASALKERINQRFWIEQDGSYADFYGSRSQAVSAAEGAIKQIGLKGADKLTQRDKGLIAHYERLKAEFSALPEAERGWITNENWVIATPMETGIAPRARAIALLDKIRRENSGEYGPYLSAVERRSMMTISTGVQAVAEGKYGRTDEAMWYVDRIVQTFNRVSPGSISEMMPDHGCFTIAWTSYGIVLPLVEHVFGVRPDAVNKTIVFEPHLPAGWEDISIENLPVGTNRISFSRRRTGEGVVYDIEAKESGWHFFLRPNASANARYYLNGRPTNPAPSGIDMRGRRNQVLITSTH
ncbi:MAG TPA: GH116 family glycosyl hydrolase [Steroidobacteraceae bacterium]|nr:GH116 family glycosyl hydrolase [Steroidobacteraceae bacterium]